MKRVKRSSDEVGAQRSTSNAEVVRAFGEHVHDWVEYLVSLLDRVEAREGAESADAIKYRRQLKWVLAFCEGLNVSVDVNFILAHIYSGSYSVGVQAEVPRRDPIQGCYEVDSAAFAVIEKALNAKDLFLLQGPPGTGKTTAIVEIVLQTLRDDPDARILICSETHVAVDNALDRLSVCLNSDQIGFLMRHRKFSEGYQFDMLELGDVVTAARANQVWARASEAAPELTAHLWQRFAGGQHSVEKVPSWLTKNLADRHQVVGVTCNQLEHLVDSRSLPFDLAIVDECSKATLPEWMMPLSMADKGVLVGDHRQLPPTFCSEEIEVLGELRAHQERLIRDGVIERLFQQAPLAHKGALTTQYRMRPEIGEVVSQAFYDGELRHGRTQGPWANEPAIGWVTYRTKRRFPAQQHGGSGHGSPSNPIEVELIARALGRLADGLPSDQQPRSVAVITPYTAQKFLIRKNLPDHLLEELHIEVDTVDGFQGREADVVVFSFVRNHGSARFYGDPRRLNVALSRAKDRILLVGSLEYLRGRARHIPALKVLCEQPVLERHQR